MKSRVTKRQAAESIIATLRDNGHVALLAGGCVRDLLMNVEPKDYDVATDAIPQRITQLFRRTQLVGAKFGVVIVRMKGHTVEVATFRSDGDYTDGRHPDAVAFSDPVQDAHRRDFTINGMFYDPATDEVIDHVGGKRDLERRVVRAIGEPARRFEEDHLRMLRAVRFAARLRFHLDDATAEAVRAAAQKIRLISTERVRAELAMILTCTGRRRGWELLHATGLLPSVTDLSWSHDQVQAVASRLDHLPAECSEALAFATVLHALPPADAAAKCRALTCSNLVVSTVQWLLTQMPRVRQCAMFEPADYKMLLAHPCIDELIVMMTAETRAGGLPEVVLQTWRDQTAAIAPETVSPPPLVTGDDLTAMGLPPGPAYADILASIYRKQLNDVIQTREQALAEATALVRAHNE